MKKIFFVFAAVAVLFAACSKENPANEDSIIPAATTAKVYTLSATMPATKATVNELSGKFEWVSNDKIAVYDKEQSKYQIFTTNDSGESVTFSFTATDGLNHDFSGSDAYYPASRLNSAQTDLETQITIASAGDVPMKATNNGGSLEFDYEAAVVKLTVNHVPSFTESVEFVNDGISYAAVVNHSSNEDMVFYFVVAESNSASSEINLYDTANNKFVAKSFDLSGGKVVKGALIPLKTTVGYPILVENGTSWGGLDIYCYSATDTWKNADWGYSLATVNTITLGSKEYSYIIAKGTADSYSFVFRKPYSDYPRVEHKGIAVSGETKVVLNTTTGARLEGDSTPRIIVWNQDKQAPVYIHYWGNGISGTTWGSDTEPSRQMIYMTDGHMVMSSKCSGLIYTGDSLNSGEWYFYYDFVDFGSASSFNFRLHQGENNGSEFTDVAIETVMKYGWWNNNNGGSWGAGAWKL